MGMWRLETGVGANVYCSTEGYVLVAMLLISCRGLLSLHLNAL